MPGMQWFHNSVELAPKPRFKITTDQEKGESTLEISQITRQDAGAYQIVVENNVGSITAACIVTIKCNYLVTSD